MEAVITEKAREKILQARMGVKALPKIVGFAFGDGGTAEEGNVKIPSITQTMLNSELLRKEIDKYELIDNLTCRYFCTLQEDELVGKYISEIALYDAEGDIIAVKNFLKKGKDPEWEMTFQIDDSMKD